jgi:Fe-S oxidoreductase
MWLETPVGERFSDLRVREARQVGADILATACPFCAVCLEDSLKSLEIEDLRIMDIAEVAAMALGVA